MKERSERFIPEPSTLALPAKEAELMYIPKESARLAVQYLKPGQRVCGITGGQFSLVDLIHECVQKFGPGDVVACAWSAALQDINLVGWMLELSLVRSFRLITDYSIVSRAGEFCESMRVVLGDRNIRTLDVHAKFVLIKTDNAYLCIRTSMNLNANPRCELFEIDDCQTVYDFYHFFVEQVFAQMPPGFVGSHAAATSGLNRAFENVGQEKQPESWINQYPDW